MVESALKVGDRVRLITETLAWRAEIALQGQIGEIIERREDGRITIRFDNANFPWPESLSPLSSCRVSGWRRRGHNDEVAGHSRRSLFFDECLRARYAAKGRQQAAGSDKVERTDGLQTRRNGQGHQAVGW